MTFGRHWIAVAAVVPLLLLGACSQDDPQPKFSPPSDSPSATESTSTEPVVRPWEKKTEAGAVAFAKHWVEVFNAAAVSGDVAELEHLSGKDCETCSNFTKLIREISSHGTFENGDGWEVIETSDPQVLAEGQTAIALRIMQPAETIRREGEPVERHPGGKVTYSARLLWKGQSWMMDQLFVVS